MANKDIASQLEERLVQQCSSLLVVFEHKNVDWPSLYVDRNILENGGPEPGTPPEILGYLAEPKWRHFIWIPSCTANGDVEQFTMQYAHELQHYRQGLNSELVRSARAFLNELRRDGWMPFLEFESKPAEFDAHRNAIHVFQEIHGLEVLNNYISRASSQEKMARFYKHLIALCMKWNESSFSTCVEHNKN